MGVQSVNELNWVINQNGIDELLLKAEALLRIAIHSELQKEPPYVLHDYLWVLNDLIQGARKLL